MQSLHNVLKSTIAGFLFITRISYAESHRLIFQWWYYGFSIFCIFCFSKCNTYCWKHYLERLRKNFYIFFNGSLQVKREQGGLHYHAIVWDKRSSEKPKIYMEFFYVSFQKNIYSWIQQFCLGWKQKYLWKRFYTIKAPLKKGLMSN